MKNSEHTVDLHILSLRTSIVLLIILFASCLNYSSGHGQVVAALALACLFLATQMIIVLVDIRKYDDLDQLYAFAIKHHWVPFLSPSKEIYSRLPVKSRLTPRRRNRSTTHWLKAIATWKNDAENDSIVLIPRLLFSVQYLGSGTKHLSVFSCPTAACMCPRKKSSPVFMLIPWKGRLNHTIFEKVGDITKIKSKKIEIRGTNYLYVYPESKKKMDHSILEKIGCEKFGIMMTEESIVAIFERKDSLLFRFFNCSLEKIPFEELVSYGKRVADILNAEEHFIEGEKDA